MRSPSLRNLQVFEVAARLQSFRAAADTLFVTHGAVSRQVRVLEAELGVDLFVRTGQRVELTAEGRHLQTAVAKGLKLMHDAMTEIGRSTQDSAMRLRVTVLPSFASRWLQKRLPAFHAKHPEITLEVIATMAVHDLAQQRIQLGIRFGDGKWDGVQAELLARETLFPVVAKNGIGGISNSLPRTARSVLNYPLLNPYDDWNLWLKRAGVIAVAPEDGATFADAAQLLQAVEEGRGIALGREWLVRDAIADGKLVRLPGPAIKSRRAYYFVYPTDIPLLPQAKAFMYWLKEEMAI
jgi:LysR family glycine cleavage system transcriptional activator